MLSLDFILHTLNSIQRKWVYLEPIFARGTSSCKKRYVSFDCLLLSQSYDTFICIGPVSNRIPISFAVILSGALPNEESRFRRVDESFRDIMTTIGRDPKLFYLADDSYFPKLPDTLR